MDFKRHGMHEQVESLAQQILAVPVPVAKICLDDLQDVDPLVYIAIVAKLKSLGAKF